MTTPQANPGAVQATAAAVGEPDTATAVPWARQASRTPPATGRTRKTVEGLPSWDPLPPGEVMVHRRGQQ